MPKSVRPAWQRQVARLHCDRGELGGSGKNNIVSLKLLFIEGLGAEGSQVRQRVSNRVKAPE